MLNIGDYPHIWMPPGSDTIDLNGSLVCASQAAPTSCFTPYSIPTSQQGWITKVAIELTVYDPATSYFSLLQNNSPMRDYTKVSVPLGSVSTPAELYIKLMPNQPIAINVYNTTGAVVTARWRLFGWYYPQRTGGGA